MDMTYPIRPRRVEMRRMKMCVDWSGGAVQSSQGFWLSPLIFVFRSHEPQPDGRQLWAAACARSGMQRIRKTGKRRGGDGASHWPGTLWTGRSCSVALRKNIGERRACTRAQSINLCTHHCFSAHAPALSSAQDGRHTHPKAA